MIGGKKFLYTAVLTMVKAEIRLNAISPILSLVCMQISLEIGMISKY
jgi:hypothetical protein